MLCTFGTVLICLFIFKTFSHQSKLLYIPTCHFYADILAFQGLSISVPSVSPALPYSASTYSIMPEPTLISYELITSHLIGPTFDDFILLHEKISVATLAGFKLISFPPLTNWEMLTNQVHHLVSVNKLDTKLQTKVLQSLIPPPLVIFQCFLICHLEGSLSNGTSIAYEGHHLSHHVLVIWMVSAAVYWVQGCWDKSLKWMWRQERRIGPCMTKWSTCCRIFLGEGQSRGLTQQDPAPSPWSLFTCLMTGSVMSICNSSLS